MAKCKSCPATVWWYKTIAGKAIPMDGDEIGPLRYDDGTYVFTPNGRVAVDRSSPPAMRTHFQSCPDSKTWRRP